MIAVYCAKAVEAAASSPIWMNLLSALLGGLLAIGGNLLVQLFVTKKVEKLEAIKRKSAFISQFLLKDIIEFIDSELLHLQTLSFSSGNFVTAVGVDPQYRWKIGSVRSAIKMYEDDELERLFNEFLLYKGQMENVNNGTEGDKHHLFELATKSSADIKSRLWVMP
ncbi:hypothetical protein I5Q17_23525 [Serratia ureilytica]|uniref:hypothetical protein n=1 Tax=Serratia ureilytica TaxID=300181 RepID=UPI0018D998A5|nr:hypothetical protein [Serratia ureilytica]MBH2947350.1 hypothetical protein [Serratia ureilytica]